MCVVLHHPRKGVNLYHQFYKCRSLSLSLWSYTITQPVIIFDEEKRAREISIANIVPLRPPLTGHAYGRSSCSIEK